MKLATYNVANLFERARILDLATTALRATARVLRAVDADVQAIVEADSRAALERFFQRFVAGPRARYAPAMLIDGKDDRGIDVGLVVRRGDTITRMRSHMGDTDREGVIFSRDCAEYAVRTPGGAELVLLVNHFKSRGYGSQAESLARRRRQARRVAQLYRTLVGEGHTQVAVVGDLNDHPRSRALATLLRRTSLRDVSSHPSFLRRCLLRHPRRLPRPGQAGLSPRLVSKFFEEGLEPGGGYPTLEVDVVVGPASAGFGFPAPEADGYMVDGSPPSPAP